VAQRSTQTGGPRRRGEPAAAGSQAAYERLSASVAAARVALKELRRELGRGSRELLQDVGLTLRDAQEAAPRQPPAAGGARTGTAGRRRQAPHRTGVQGDPPRLEPGRDDGAQARHRQVGFGRAAPGSKRSGAGEFRGSASGRGLRVAGKFPPDLPPLEPEGPPDEEPEPDEPLEPALRPEEEPVPA